MKKIMDRTKVLRRYFLLIGFLLICQFLYSQSDLIVLNKDTIKCRIIENSPDTIYYKTDSQLFKVSKNRMTFNKKDLIIPLSINFIKFSENPNISYTTQDLLQKLDFSNSSPFAVWKEDFSTKSRYIAGFDTSKNRLYWFGLDFSNFGIHLGVGTRVQFSQTFLYDCNDFILTDNSFKGFINSFSFILDTGFVVNRIGKLNLANIYNKSNKIFPLDTIRSILKTIKTERDGVGLIIFVTNINKESESETFYVTFFDLKSKSVLLCLKETSSTNGVGMSWHWTKPIIEFLVDLTKKNDWKKRYYSKPK